MVDQMMESSGLDGTQDRSATSEHDDGLLEGRTDFIDFETSAQETFNVQRRILTMLLLGFEVALFVLNMCNACPQSSCGQLVSAVPRSVAYRLAARSSSLMAGIEAQSRYNCSEGQYWNKRRSQQIYFSVLLKLLL